MPSSSSSSRSSKTPNPPPPLSRQAKGAYAQQFSQPIVGKVAEKGAEHATIIVNLAELATIGGAALVTAEVNHTRPATNIWVWRIVEMLSSLPVLAYNGHKNTLGRIALGVFIGAAVESLVDSTPGLTGGVVWTPPADQQIRYVIE